MANTEPKPCLPGYYNQQMGQSTCKLCPLGTICPGFTRLLPEACPPGYVCDTTGLAIPRCVNERSRLSAPAWLLRIVPRDASPTRDPTPV